MRNLYRHLWIFVETFSEDFLNFFQRFMIFNSSFWVQTSRLFPDFFKTTINNDFQFSKLSRSCVKYPGLSKKTVFKGFLGLGPFVIIYLNLVVFFRFHSQENARKFCCHLKKERTPDLYASNYLSTCKLNILYFSRS